MLHAINIRHNLSLVTHLFKNILNVGTRAFFADTKLMSAQIIRQEVNVQRNTYFTHYCSGKAINITYSECCVRSFRYPAYKAQAPYCIVICDLSGCSRKGTEFLFNNLFINFSLHLFHYFCYQ